ncbi:unnamed protein product [Urochloa decumbens]|uniref:F-box domain-containing protein n=1 Tax=Urochloa decumbens TaxID=240449 RepID=A0ABC8VI39_9POAL
MLAEMSPPSPADLADDDALAEILLLLPPPSVLRSRAVCKRWRRVTTCPSFVAAYSARRPLELLVYPDGYKLWPDSKNILAGVDPLDPGAWGYRRFLRMDRSLRLVDSRDGLLLLALGNTAFVLCNPATRQLARLPSPAPAPCMRLLVSGLYFHRPSGEHRVLCIGHNHRREGGRDFHYILSTGSGEPRRLGPVATATGRSNPIPSACVALGATLHWAHHPEADNSRMVAFDTESEAFRLIPLPPLAAAAGGDLPPHIRAFDMDGTLAVSALVQGSLRMDVWALEAGAGGEAWARRLRIDLPPRRVREYWSSDEAVAVVEGGRLLVVVGAGWVALHDVRTGRTVSRVDYSGEIGNVSRCLYRMSLVPLPVPPGQPPHGGEEPSPPLHYWSPDDTYMSQFRSDCGSWMLPDIVYANA